MCEKGRKHMCITDRQDMNLGVNVALNPNATTNQPNSDITIIKITVSHLLKTNSIIWTLFELLSANALNLDQCKFLSCGKEKTLFSVSRN